MADSTSSVQPVWNAPAILGVIFGAILLVIEGAHLIVAIIAHRVSISFIAIYSPLLIVRISMRAPSLVFQTRYASIPNGLRGLLRLHTEMERLLSTGWEMYAGWLGCADMWRIGKG